MVECADDGIVFYHRNDNVNTEYDIMIDYQDLHNVADSIDNILKDRTFGGYMYLKGSKTAGTYEGIYAETDFVGYSIKSINKKWKYKCNGKQKLHTRTN